MQAQTKTLLKLSLAAVLALAMAGFLWGRLSSLWQSGEADAKLWFFDQSQKQLYALPSDSVPPHKGIGGKSGDGVRAVVVVFRCEQNQSLKRRIAYLETYSPQLKELLERIQAARAARQKFNGPMPSRESDFFQTNTLVKRPEEPTWSVASSPEGRKLQAQWRSWRGPDGQAPIVCVP